MGKDENWFFRAWDNGDGTYAVKTFLGNPVDERLKTWLKLKEDLNHSSITKQEADDLAEDINKRILKHNKK